MRFMKDAFCKQPGDSRAHPLGIAITYSPNNYIRHVKAASVQEIKAELSHLSQKQLLTVCNRLARFKKENKELLTYLLFEAHDEAAYISSVKSEMDLLFLEVPKEKSTYLIKKNLRKILRFTNKHMRYTSSKETEAELLVYYCKKLKQSKIPITKSAVLTNLYQTQIKKIGKLVKVLHEDLRFDYEKELQELM